MDVMLWGRDAVLLSSCELLDEAGDVSRPPRLPELKTDSDEEAWARRQGETSGKQRTATKYERHKHTKPAQRRDGAAREDEAREEGVWRAQSPANGLTD